MPSKAKKEVNSPDEQFNRRRSARLAGLDKEKTTESPKAAKKEPARKKSRKTVSDKMSKGDIEIEPNADMKNHTDKKLDISKDEDDLKKTDTKDTVEIEEGKIVESDFVVVKKNEVPSADSNEVKEAIKAQGEDGELLVNFVQVTHDDVPDATKVVPAATINGICTTNNLESGKIEEPQQPQQSQQQQLADEAKISSV